MEFTVSIDLDNVRALTEDNIDDLVDGLADYEAAVRIARDLLGCGAIMTIEADDAMLAGHRAVDIVTAIVGPGRVVGCEALTSEEFAERFARSALTL